MIYAKVFPTNFFLLSKTAFRVSVPNYEVDMMSSVNTFIEVNGKNGKSRQMCILKTFYCHFPIGILCKVWCLVVSIPDLCPLSYFFNKALWHVD